MMKVKNLIEKMDASTRVRFFADLRSEGIPYAFMETFADDFIKVPELSWVLDKDVLGIHICWTDRAAEVTVSLH